MTLSNGYYGKELTRGLKKRRISDWKRQNIICRPGETYEDLHDIYHNAVKCESCKLLFEGGRGTNTGKLSVGKCLDHCHITGYYRQIICRSCNTGDRFVKFYICEWLDMIDQF
jgi:hypothetical protein